MLDAVGFATRTTLALLLAYMLAALLISLPLHWLLIRSGWPRWAWNPPLAETGLYICLLGAAEPGRLRSANRGCVLRNSSDAGSIPSSLARFSHIATMARSLASMSSNGGSGWSSSR